MRKGKLIASVLCITIFLAVLTACQPAASSSMTTASTTAKATTQAASTAVQTTKASFSAPDAANVSPAGKFPIAKAQVTLSICIQNNSLVKDFVDNAYTKKLEEIGNVKLKFEILPSGSDGTQKYKVMMASPATLPDISVISLSDAEKARYGSQGIFIRLDEYINEYGMNYKTMLQETELANLQQLLTSPDGKVYALPQLNESVPNAWPVRLYINKKWLDALNLAMPVTTDDFYKVMLAFRDKDPNGNGKKDEIPLVGANAGSYCLPTDFLINAFIYNDTKDYFVVNKGKLSYAYLTKEWQNAMIYLNKLCVEDLLAPESFTQDEAQLKLLTQNADAQLVGAFTASGLPSAFNAKNARMLDYVAVPPLTGPEGVCLATYAPSLPSNAFFITANCKNPAAAFRIGDFMLSEEMSIWPRWGVEGVDWAWQTDPEAKPIYGEFDFRKKEYLVVINDTWGVVQSSHWRQTGPFFRKPYPAVSQKAPKNPLDNFAYWVGLSLQVTMGKGPKEYVSRLIYTENEMTRVSELSTTISTYLKETIARFVTNDLDPAKDWNGYLDTLKKMGVEEMLKYAQTAYDRMQMK